ncbi:MAG TPA: alpha/beta hydrolase [Candidatus Saccharimonadales bacterium]|nr:alpha/beta hydrolase [Candidatus Saccharimonadales bacterium]
MPIQRVGDIDLYYEFHGTGDAVVLIGGLGNDITESQRLIAWLARTHRVLAFDNRGAGRTDKPDILYSIEMMAADTAGLMKALDICGATVLGISMGGKIAMELTLEHPELVTRLILVSTSAAARPDNGPTRMEMLSFLARFVFRGKHPQPAYAQGRQRQASHAYDCTDRLDEIQAPATIMHGRNDRIVPLRRAEELRHGIAHSQLVTFRGGHLFFMRKERTWFLDSVDTALTFGDPVKSA